MLFIQLNTHLACCFYVLKPTNQTTQPNRPKQHFMPEFVCQSGIKTLLSQTHSAAQGWDEAGGQHITYLITTAYDK